MIKSNVRTVIDSHITSVWNVVTNPHDYSWRSDLSKVEVSDDGNTFIEYTRANQPTTFTVIRKDEYYWYEFTMENKYLKGRWIGNFCSRQDGSTEIDFKEEIEVNNRVMKLLAKSYLRRHQIKYIRDLRRKLKQQPS